jgi:hypothetical protein
MDIIYIILGAILISILIGGLIYLLIEAVNVKKNKIVGGCSTTRYGCCPDGTTSRNESSSNCK